MMGKKVWAVHVMTDGSDHYLYAFKTKPTKEQVCKLVAEREGNIEDASWYEDSCCVDIEECDVL